MRITLSSCTLLLGLLLALPAAALELPAPPAGTCPLNNEQDTDKRALNFLRIAMQTPGTLKALFAECAQLEQLRLRQGPSVTVYDYGAVVEQTASLPEGITREQAISLLAAGAGISAANASQAMNPTVAERALAVPSYQGILKQGPQMVIFGSEQRHAANGVQYSMAAVSAVTVVGGKFVSVNLFDSLKGKETFTRLADEAEAYTNRILAANPS